MRSILGVLLMVGGAIMVLFFSRYSGSVIPYPWLWLLASMGAAYLGYRLVLPRSDFAASQNEWRDEINDIRERGIAVKVDFDKCRITDLSYSYEKERESGRIAGMNVLSGNEMDNVREVRVGQTEFIYTYTDPTTNQQREYKADLDMDRDTVSMTFLARDVMLYIDPDDPDRYFFDFGVRSN